MKIKQSPQPLTYYGGKSKLSNKIIKHIPAHSLYCEPFCGGASIFFRKELATVNILNDLNKNLIIFYRVLVSDMEGLEEKISTTIHSRSQYEHARYVYNNYSFFSDLEIAWSIWVLSKLGFCGQLDSGFCVCKSTKQMTSKINNSKNLSSYKVKLENATIENIAALEIIKRYDNSNAFFFIDPPYVGTEMKHYKGMFDENKLKELLESLSSIKGKFIFTMYPNTMITQFVNKNNWHSLSIIRDVGTMVKHRREQEELIIANFEIK